VQTLIQYSEGNKNVQYDLAGSLKIEHCEYFDGAFVGQCVVEPHGFYYQDGLELDMVRSTKFYLETR
jgi:hypothetical protein